MAEKKVGSQVKYTDETLQAIEDGLAEGKGLKRLVESLRHDYHTFRRWMEADEERVQRFARARSKGAEALVEQALEIADDESKDTLSAGDDREFPNNVAVNRAKTRIDTRLKIAAFYDRAKFGNKTEVEHKGALPVAMTADDKVI